MGKSKIYTEVTQALDTALNRLSDIWNEIGIVSEGRDRRSKLVMLHVGNLLDEMVSEEELLKKRLLANVEKYGKELQELCNDLSLPIYEPENGTTILQIEKELRTRVDSLSQEKHARMKHLRQLKDQEQHLCDILCTTPYYIPSGTIPSEQQLVELRQHIASLQEEKDKRHNQFKTTKSSILRLLEELDQSPDTSLAINICEEEESFLLSTDKLKEMKQYLEELESTQKANFSQAADLRDRLTTLWNRLKVTDEERSKFTTEYTGFKPRTIKALKEEISKYELQKLQYIESVIEETRTELKGWWEKCFLSQTDRNGFTAFKDKNYTEELLELHDAEVERLRAYYNEHCVLFEKVAKRQQLWGEFLEFERKASDPKRLFNRGWNALKEEKNRKRILKDLPKVENEVKEEIRMFEEKTGQHFLVEGVRFEDFVQMQWANQKQQKENEKEQRQKAKSKELQEEMIYGSKPVTPAKRRFQTPSKSPGNLTKLRRLNDTHKTPVKSRLAKTQTSLFMSPMAPTPRSVKRRPVTRSSTSQQVLSDRSHSSLQNVKSGRQLRNAAKKMIDESTLFSHTTVSSSNGACGVDASLASIGQYTEFAKGLNQNARPNCRSSIMPKAAYF